MAENVREIVDESKLVDCPRCGGFAMTPDDCEICLCCTEYSRGYTPGKLPLSEVKRLGLTRHPSLGPAPEKPGDSTPDNNEQESGV